MMADERTAKAWRDGSRLSPITPAELAGRTVGRMNPEPAGQPAGLAETADRAFADLNAALDHVETVDPDLYVDLAAAYCTQLAVAAVMRAQRLYRERRT